MAEPTGPGAAPLGRQPGHPAAARRPSRARTGLWLAAALLAAALLLPPIAAAARAAGLRAVAEGLVEVGRAPARAAAVAVHGGGGPQAEREQVAADLWRRGRVDRVVALGGPLPLRDPDRTYARAVERRLRALGVPPEAITRLDAGASTAGELQALRQLAEAEGWPHVVLASSRWQTRRISLLADQVFAGTTVQWTVVGTPELGFDASAWWDDPAARGLVLSEWSKIALALAFPAGPGQADRPPG